MRVSNFTRNTRMHFYIWLHFASCRASFIFSSFQPTVLSTDIRGSAFTAESEFKSDEEEVDCVKVSAFTPSQHLLWQGSMCSITLALLHYAPSADQRPLYFSVSTQKTSWATSLSRTTAQILTHIIHDWRRQTSTGTNISSQCSLLLAAVGDFFFLFTVLSH